MMEEMDVKFPVKKEKFSERMTFFVEPSTKQSLAAAEKDHGLDVPQFMRDLLRTALEELKAQTTA